MARRGATTVRQGGRGGSQGDRRGEPGDVRRSEPFVPERFARVDDREGTRAPGTGGRGRAAADRLRPPAGRSASGPAELPADIVQELATAAGPDWNHLRPRVTERMAAGMGAFERERYRDAARILRVVADLVPNAPSVQELLGLAQYHQGFWRAALPPLEAFAALTGSVDQHPVRMDCLRALGRPAKVAALFDELRQGSPEPEVLTEGRLVLAGTWADRGDLEGAIRLLVDAGAGRLVRNPADRHLRQWYVLGDLMERSGDLARARELFGRIEDAEPGAYDVEERLAALGPPSAPRSRRRPPGGRRNGR